MRREEDSYRRGLYTIDTRRYGLALRDVRHAIFWEGGALKPRNMRSRTAHARVHVADNYRVNKSKRQLKQRIAEREVFAM